MTGGHVDDEGFAPFDPVDFWLFERMVPGPETHLDAQELALLSELARLTLRIETLETRSRDCLDFHEVAVWCLKEALARAYLAGTRRHPAS